MKYTEGTNGSILINVIKSGKALFGFCLGCFKIYLLVACAFFFSLSTALFLVSRFDIFRVDHYTASSSRSDFFQKGQYKKVEINKYVLQVYMYFFVQFKEEMHSHSKVASKFIQCICDLIQLFN